MKINNDGENLKILYEDVDSLNREKEAVDKEYLGVKERLQKANIIFDQVSGWAFKILNKLSNTVKNFLFISYIEIF